MAFARRYLVAVGNLGMSRARRFSPRIPSGQVRAGA